MAGMTARREDTMTRYGMKFDTIRYFLNQGRELNRMTGWSPANNRRTFAAQIDGMTAREIARFVIKCAGAGADMRRVLESR